MIEIEEIPGVSTAVGESPVWDPETGSLWLLDLVKSGLIQVDAADEVRVWATPSAPGALALAAGGRLALALETGFCLFDPASGAFGPTTPDRLREDVRVTEGKADRQGRLVGVSSDPAFSFEPIGAVVRWEHDGSTTAIRHGVRLGNGLAWSRDGRTMYLADSIEELMWAFDYDPASGELGPERVFHSFRDSPGFPDGATVDADDHVWVVVHDTPTVLRIAPDGRVVDELTMPSPMITSVAFGGPDLDVLHVTSLDPRQLPGLPPERRRDVEGGTLYRVHGLGVRGLPETPMPARS